MEKKRVGIHTYFLFSHTYERIIYIETQGIHYGETEYQFTQLNSFQLS